MLPLGALPVATTPATAYHHDRGTCWHSTHMHDPAWAAFLASDIVATAAADAALADDGADDALMTMCSSIIDDACAVVV